MSVRIRLRRTGKRNAACYRVVVADARSPRDGRFIETIGLYDPRHKDERIDVERAEYWIAKGARPSETVTALLERAKSGKLKQGIVKEAAPVQQETPKAPEAEKAEEAPAEEAPAEEVAEETAE